MRGRLDHDEATAKFGGLNLTTAELRAVDRIILTACGTSWHAALVGEYLIEEFARMPVEVEYASEFRYRNPPIETAHARVRHQPVRRDRRHPGRPARGASARATHVLAICNVVGSTIAREADGGIYLHAGPEIGVASTKAFTSQVAVADPARPAPGPHPDALRQPRAADHRRPCETIPDQIARSSPTTTASSASPTNTHEGRGLPLPGPAYNFPVALEGALKLKEISYIHAEGYPAAEMKHGPIALIDDKTPSVFVIPSDAIYDKIFSNIEEIKARKGPIIAIATEGDRRHRPQADDVIYIPRTLEPLVPLLTVIPLQLLAYHIAVARGCDVDKPRNLAKSVTVE